MNDDLSDAELLRRYLNARDEAAFAAIVRCHGPMVRGVCRRTLGDCHDVDDAFQATFLVLVRRAGAIKPPSLLGNWLYGAARRAALKVRTMPLDDELARLPDKYRAVIVLSDLEGKSRAETARQLGVPEGTISSRLHRGREMPRRRLVRRGLVLAPGALAAALAQQAAADAASSLALEAIALRAAFAGAASVRVGSLASGVLKSAFVFEES